MDMALQGLVAELIPIVLFISVATVIALFFKWRSAERMAIIEKGLTGEDLKYLYARRPTHPRNIVKWALIFLFGGVGIAVAVLVSEATGNNGYGFGIVILSIGLALLVYYTKFAMKAPDEEGTEPKSGHGETPEEGASG